MLLQSSSYFGFGLWGLELTNICTKIFTKLRLHLYMKSKNPTENRNELLRQTGLNDRRSVYRPSYNKRQRDTKATRRRPTLRTCLFRVAVCRTAPDFRADRCFPPSPWRWRPRTDPIGPSRHPRPPYVRQTFRGRPSGILRFLQRALTHMHTYTRARGRESAAAGFYNTARRCTISEACFWVISARTQTGG